MSRIRAGVNWSFVGLAMIAVMAGASPAFAQVPACTPGPAVWTLWAGQTINVGTVTVDNDATNLFVTYALTYPGATFGTLHLWVGNDLTNLPTTQPTKNNPGGTPIPGQFPYQTGDAAGATSYTFTIPLGSLGIVDVANSCPLTLYAVSHAEVNLDGNTSGEHETAFGGDRTGSGPRWWYYGAYCLTCEFGQPATLQCATAFAKGGWVFVTDRKSNPENLPTLGLIKNRWGWAINVTAPGVTTYDIWAGAGLNKISNGVRVGSLTVDWNGSSATIAYTLDSPNVMEEVHIYASDFKPTTTAPGQYGNLAYFDPKRGSYITTVQVSDSNGDGIWIIAHAAACWPQ